MKSVINAALLKLTCLFTTPLWFVNVLTAASRSYTSVLTFSVPSNILFPCLFCTYSLELNTFYRRYIFFVWRKVKYSSIYPPTRRHWMLHYLPSREWHNDQWVLRETCCSERLSKALRPKEKVSSFAANRIQQRSQGTGHSPKHHVQAGRPAEQSGAESKSQDNSL